FFQAEDGIRDRNVTGVQTCALPIYVITGKSECPGFVIRGTDIDGIKRGELLSIPYRFHAQGNFASRKLQDGDIIFEVSGGSKNKIGRASCRERVEGWGREGAREGKE